MESKNEEIYFWKKRLYSHNRLNSNSLELTKVALQKVYSTISSGGKILFISTKKQASEAIAELANETNQYLRELQMVRWNAY